MIEIRNLSKYYNKHQALKQISFVIPDRGVLGFLGRNGAGKSTTMNIITGYLAPSGGQIFFNGTEIHKCEKEAKRSIGYLPEVPPLYPDMTINEYLRFVCRIKDVMETKAQAHVDMICEMTGLKDHKKRLIRNLSKGYRQRTGMAQAIIGNPALIILDEPTAGLDPIQILEIEDLIRKLGQEHSVVFSSHILQEVSEVCEGIVIIDHGEVLAQRSLKDQNKVYSLTIRGNDKITNKISAISEISSISIVSTTDYSTSYHLTVNDDSAFQDAIFYMLVQENRPILELKELQDSIQDLFLQTTHSEREE